jgi:hypothetical protein
MRGRRRPRYLAAYAKAARETMTHTFQLEGRATFPATAGAEALAGPWIHGPFPARVKGADAGGRRFKVTTVLENMSVGCCHVRLEGPAAPGAQLFVVTRIDRAVVVLRGTVVGVRAHAGGAHSVSVRITRYRFVHRRPGSE